MAILSELLVASEACEVARQESKLASYPSEAGVYLVFGEDDSAPLLCALDLSGMLKELPLMSVRMVLHCGEVEVGSGPTGRPSALGEGIDEVRQLFETAEPGEIFISDDFAESMTDIGNLNLTVSSPKPLRGEPQRIVLVGTANASVTEAMASALSANGYGVWWGEDGAHGVAWAKALDSHIREADAVIAVVSRASAKNELLQQELEIAVDERRKRGRPHILPVWLDEPGTDVPTALSQSLYQAVWAGESDFERVIDEVRATLAVGQAVCDADRLDTTGKAVSEDSNFYVRRAADDVFETAIGNRESIILLKGPRQIGKTTLLGRGIGLVDTFGWRCVATDFQMLGARQLDSEQAFYRVVVTTLCRQANFDYDFDYEWLENLTPILNMDRFMRELLESSDQPLAWFMDEADRLFTSPLATDFFALVRSWHNARATDPMGPWGRLVIAIGYAAEAHLFIRDLNKSPFNVGRRVELPMLTRENLVDLNSRYGSPLTGGGEIEQLFGLLSGQPFLTNRAFQVLAGGTTFETLLATADRDDGPFGDHLRRILLSVSQFPEVWAALVESLTSPNLKDSEGLHRLVAANVLVRNQNGKYELPLELYRRYLERYAIPEVS